MTTGNTKSTGTTRSTGTTGRAPDATWAVEHFARFWGGGEGRGDRSRIAPDIVGHWPDGCVLRGIEQYMSRLIAIGTLIPDIRLDVLESAVNGDLAFIRWRARGTGRQGEFELFGVDRVRVEREQIKENIIHFDTAAFASAVGVPFPASPKPEG